MNVIHVSFSDTSGGAARAAYRIHDSLLEAKLNSTMKVWSRVSDDPTVQGDSSKFGRMVMETRTGIGLLSQKILKTSNPVRHSAAWLPSGWLQSLNTSNADIVHLHWVGAETLSIREIGQIRKPVVWTFHDMWGFCGAEHYMDDGLDARWRHGYKSDNRPVNESGFDLNRWTWERKRRQWQRPFHIVCPSHWLANCVKSSALMRDWAVSVIPYPLDLESFRPIEKGLARQLLKLPQDKALILFGATGGSRDLRKGSDLLVESLSFLKTQELRDMELVIFGQSRPLQTPELGFPIRYTGHLHDDISLALLYSAVDVFVAPSRQDNLPNTVIEAIACGTPTVAFKVGGMPDLIQHQVSGYLAHPYDIGDLAKGIQWVLEQQQENNSLAIAARQQAELIFNSSQIAKQYLAVYEQAQVNQKAFLKSDERSKNI